MTQLLNENLQLTENLDLNLYGAINIFNEYKIKLKEDHLRLLENRNSDEKLHSKYIATLQKTKSIILDIRQLLSLVPYDKKLEYEKTLNEIEVQCKEYETNGNKIINIYNDIYNQKLLLDGDFFIFGKILNQLKHTERIFEKVYLHLTDEYMKLSKYVIKNSIIEKKIKTNYDFNL